MQHSLQAISNQQSASPCIVWIRFTQAIDLHCSLVLMTSWLNRINNHCTCLEILTFSLIDLCSINFCSNWSALSNASSFFCFIPCIFFLMATIVLNAASAIFCLYRRTLYQQHTGLHSRYSTVCPSNWLCMLHLFYRALLSYWFYIYFESFCRPV